MKCCSNLVFLIVFSLGLFFQKLSAQPAEFAPLGATWWYNQTEMFPPYNIALNKFEVIGDTIIDGYDLRILKYDFIRNNGTGYSYNYFVNNDSGEITLYNVGAHNLEPYFNFNAVVGDTILTTCPYDEFAYSVVDSIIDVVINGLSLKRFYITPADLEDVHNSFPGGEPYNYFTERIGNSYYFFPIPGAVDPPPGGSLRCYEDAELGLYGSDVVTDCDYLTHVIDLTSSVFTLSPNPSNGIVDITVIKPNNYEFLLVDCNGKLTSLNKMHNAVFVNRFDFSYLPSGCYTIIAIESNQFAGQQLVIKL